MQPGWLNDPSKGHSPGPDANPDSGFDSDPGLDLDRIRDRMYGVSYCLLYNSRASCNYNITHTHPFNGPLSGTTRVSRYQKGKTNLDFSEARDSEWQLHQLGHVQVCTSLQTDNHASTPPLSFFTEQELIYIHEKASGPQTLRLRAAGLTWNRPGFHHKTCDH